MGLPKYLRSKFELWSMLASIQLVNSCWYQKNCSFFNLIILIIIARDQGFKVWHIIGLLCSHGSYCGNFLLLRFLNKIFRFKAVNPIIGTYFPYSSVEPHIWLPKTQFMTSLATVIIKIDFVT